MEYKKISEVTSVVTGGTPSTAVPEYWENGTIPWLQSGCCQNCDVYKADKLISQSGYDNSSTKLMPKDTVMIALTGATAGKIGYLNFEACGNQSITGILPCDLLNQRFLFYYLISKRPQILSDCVGGAQAHISQGYVKNIEVPLYSLEEQAKIVKIMDKTMSVIDNGKETLEQLDDLIKSRFVEMFGDTVTNSKQWEEHTLNEYITFLTSGSRGWAQYYTDERGEVFITIKNVKNNHISLDNVQYVNAPKNKEAERTKVQTGDLLISITADLGRTGVIEENVAAMGAYINQHLSLVRLDSSKINPLYVSYFLETDGGKRQFETKNQNGVKAGLNFDAIKSLKILVPPLEIQNEYLTFVASVDKLKVELQKTMDETQKLFDSLMQQYFG